MERACTTHSQGSPAPRTLLHSSTLPSLPQQAQEPERFPHVLQPKDVLSGFVPVLVAPRAGGATWALGSGLNQSRHTEELAQFTPVPPHWFASMTRVGAPQSSGQG